MTPIRISTSPLREGRWYEYVIRFALGGTATVFTGLVSSRYGASMGGLFLALPAIFCASATLIEKHEIRRKREAALAGESRGRYAAALDAAGAHWERRDCWLLPSFFGRWSKKACQLPSWRHRSSGWLFRCRPGMCAESGVPPGWRETLAAALQSHAAYNSRAGPQRPPRHPIGPPANPVGCY